MTPSFPRNGVSGHAGAVHAVAGRLNRRPASTARQFGKRCRQVARNRHLNPRPSPPRSPASTARPTRPASSGRSHRTTRRHLGIHRRDPDVHQTCHRRPGPQTALMLCHGSHGCTGGSLRGFGAEPTQLRGPATTGTSREVARSPRRRPSRARLWRHGKVRPSRSPSLDQR